MGTRIVPWQISIEGFLTQRKGVHRNKIALTRVAPPTALRYASGLSFLPQ